MHRVEEVLLVGAALVGVADLVEVAVVAAEGAAVVLMKDLLLRLQVNHKKDALFSFFLLC